MFLLNSVNLTKKVGLKSINTSNTNVEISLEI
jgi:hypothetical protein